MDEKNLDIYGNKAIPWSRPLKQLEANTHGSYWLATVGSEHLPHVAAVGALWVDGKFYFVSGPATRKSRNLATNPNCTISASLGDLDLVVTGTAEKVSDDPTLRRIADLYSAQGWDAKVRDGAITADYSAPSAGPAPWELFVVTPSSAVGVATAEPNGATRWRFMASDP